MSETMFTPGPWIAGVSAVIGAARFSVVPECNKGRVVSICGDCGAEDEEESIANTYLIAAAPDMYEALEDILQLASTETTRGELVYIDFTEIRDVLKKARGEQ